MFNTTFNNISDKSWRQVLLVEVTGVPGENHRSAANIVDYVFYIIGVFQLSLQNIFGGGMRSK